MAKLEASTFQSENRSEQRIRVPVRSLDAMVSDGSLPTPALIKLDVEGAEVMVLNGAMSVLRSARPELFLEVHSSALLDECREILEGEGYRLISLDRDPGAAKARDVFQIHARPEARLS